MNKPFYRRCEFLNVGKKVPGLFHRWDNVVEPNDITTEYGTKVTMALPSVVGIVEDDNGCVHVVGARYIRFTDGFSDRLLNKWQWGDDKDES